jgi:hypothetical protein
MTLSKLRLARVFGQSMSQVRQGHATQLKREIIENFMSQVRHHCSLERCARGFRMLATNSLDRRGRKPLRKILRFRLRLMIQRILGCQFAAFLQKLPSVPRPPRTARLGLLSCRWPRVERLRDFHREDGRTGGREA